MEGAAMTWTLKSGRILKDVGPSTELRPYGKRGAYVDSFAEGGCDCCAAIEYLTGPLTPAERREIADAVIAAWNRWAETGEP